MPAATAASIGCWSMGRPPTGRSCLTRPAPMRRPSPAARMTQQTVIGAAARVSCRQPETPTAQGDP